MEGVEEGRIGECRRGEGRADSGLGCCTRVKPKLQSVLDWREN